MTLEEGDRRRRRRIWRSLLIFTLLAYPVLLLGSSYFGSSLGMLRDVNASRALARALSYAADTHSPVEPGNDGQLATAALDSNLAALQLSDLLAPGGTALAGAANSPPGAPPIGGTPAGGGGGTGRPSPNPTAPPSPDPTAPPPSPPPSPTASPTPGPTPCSGPQPAGTGTFDGKVVDAQGAPVLLATVSLFWCNRLVGSATTVLNGTFAIHGLAPNTNYTYTFSALLHPQGNGAFVSGANGNHNQTLHF